jgi:hypothetical protein
VDNSLIVSGGKRVAHLDDIGDHRTRRETFARNRFRQAVSMAQTRARRTQSSRSAQLRWRRLPAACCCRTAS